MIAWMMTLVAAMAGEMEIQTAQPARILVDGVLVQQATGPMVLQVSDLPAGMHKVEFRGPRGRLLAARELVIADDEWVQLAFGQGQIQILDRQVLVAPVTASVSMAAPGMQVAVAGQPAQTSETVSVSLGGMSASVTVTESTTSTTTVAQPVVVPPAQPVTEHVVVHHVVQEPAPVQASPQVISGSDFQSLLARVQAESFSDDKLSLIQSASGYHWFRCEQVARLMGSLTFSDDQIAAARILRPRIVDPQNHHVFNDVLDFSDDKQAVQAMFMQ